MHIEFLNAKDVNRYRSLMLQAYEQAPDAFKSSVEERAAEPDSWWKKRIGEPGGNGVAFGAFVEKELVGTVALQFSSKPKIKHRVQLIGMFVLPSSQGAGIGRALLEAAVQHARERDGTRSIVLTVTEGNAPAIYLYEACGFVAFGSEPMAIRTSNGFKAKVHMCKILVE
ncbi:MAG: RimJ/RimL family protein N-acetyltransferase [Planctomycetota bacterium]|jgi:RimJ/RimL family protein N-acetyltransferase